MNLEDSFESQQNRIVSKFNKSKIVFKGLKAGSGVQTANLKGLKDFSMLNTRRGGGDARRGNLR